MTNYAFQLNQFIVNKICSNRIIIKKTFSSQRRLKSKVARLPNDEVDALGTKDDNIIKDYIPLKNNTEKNSNKMFNEHEISVIQNHNKSLSTDNKCENISPENKIDKDVYIHYRPSSSVVPIYNYQNEFKFLKNHNDYSTINSQISDYFHSKNNELIWQEITFDLKAFYRPYLKLSKIRLTGLVVLTAMAGYIISPGEFILSQFFLVSSGVLLTSAAANTINQFFEVPFDSQMNRTKNRPLVCGNLSTQTAVYFAMASAGIGSAILYLGVNPLTCALGVGNLALYTLVYTPLKRMSIANTWVGSIVGAIPPIMGWTAVTGSIDPGGLLLGGLLFAWQFPHFCALSWNLKADYSRAGYQMMSTVAPHLCRSSSLRYSIMLTPLCTLFSHLDITTWHFAAISLLPNTYMSWLAWRFYRDADANSSRKLFRYSLVYLPIIFALIFGTKKNWGAATEMVQ